MSILLQSMHLLKMKSEAEVKITEKFISSHLSFGILMEIRKYNTLRMHSNSAQNTLELEHEKESSHQNITDFPLPLSRQYNRGVATKSQPIGENNSTHDGNVVPVDPVVETSSAMLYNNSISNSNVNEEDNSLAVDTKDGSSANIDKQTIPAINESNQ